MDKDQGPWVGSSKLAVEVVDTSETTLVKACDMVWQGRGEAGFIWGQYWGSSDRDQDGDKEAHEQGKEGLEGDGSHGEDIIKDGGYLWGLL